MASFETATYIPDRLIAGNAHLLVSRRITLAAGQTLTRGALLGRITASGKYVLSAAGATDGSEVPDLILAEDTDAAGADVETIAYQRGDFNQNAIVLGSGHSIEGVREVLREKGIVLINVEENV